MIQTLTKFEPDVIILYCINYLQVITVYRFIRCNLSMEI